MATAVVDLYLASHRARVEIRTGNFNRVSDFLNSAPGAYLTGTSQLIADLTDVSPGAWMSSTREVVALIEGVRFLDPIEEADLPRRQPELIRERIPISVEIEIDRWRISGMLHLMDLVRWDDYLHSVRGRFVPISGAHAQLAGSESVVESRLLLINGSRISALYAEAR